MSSLENIVLTLALFLLKEMLGLNINSLGLKNKNALLAFARSAFSSKLASRASSRHDVGKCSCKK